MPGFDAIILAGGTSRRAGVTDKCGQLIGQRTLLDRALDSAVGAHRICVVGPPRETEVTVHWTREEPVLGGPVAGLRAGLGELEDGAPLVVTLAGDLPFARNAVERLLTILENTVADVAIGTDPAGRDQYLLAVWRRSSLDRCLAHEVVGGSMRSLIAGAVVQRVPVSRQESLDVDSPEDFTLAVTIASGLVQ